MSLERNTVIARAAYEANRSYCELAGLEPPLSFDDQHVRESMRIGVIRALKGKTPKELHESWLVSKAQDGWVYGEVKDAEKKTHPCIVPYEKLSAADRIKDYLFRDVVLAVARALKAFRE